MAFGTTAGRGEGVSAELTSSALLDPALPLAEALDANRMREPLARAAGLREPVAAVRGDVINHKQGKRCTILYSVGGAKVVGKLYARPVLAARAHAWTMAVRLATARVDEPSAVPEPRATMPELGLGLHAHVSGSHLGSSLSPSAVVVGARWLRRLHAMERPAGVKAEPLAHELLRLDAWHQIVRSALTSRRAKELDSAYQRLQTLAAELPEPPAKLVHRDFYHENLLWDGIRLWIVDFDQVAIGDPAVDVAHFQAHLLTLAYRQRKGAEAHAALNALFARTGPPVAEAALSFYRAHTFLKLAATEVERRRPEWQAHAHAFAAMACEEAQQGGRQQAVEHDRCPSG